MRAHTETDAHRNASPALLASNEVVKRIRKLRWIGLEEEARALEESLHDLPSGWPIRSGPFDTD